MLVRENKVMINERWSISPALKELMKPAVKHMAAQMKNPATRGFLRPNLKKHRETVHFTTDLASLIGALERQASEVSTAHRMLLTQTVGEE